jgi:hypothetical protein
LVLRDGLGEVPQEFEEKKKLPTDMYNTHNTLKYAALFEKIVEI